MANLLTLKIANLPPKLNQLKSQVTLTQHGIPRLGFSRALGLISNFPWPVRTHPREHGARTGSACRVRKIRCSLRSVPCWPWASEPPRGSCADHVKPPREARNTGNPQWGETHLMVETNLFYHEQK